MARNKLVDQVNRERAAQRDHRLQVADGPNRELVDPHATPCHLAVNRDLLEQVQRRLTEEERQLAEHRMAGREWAEIAELVGGKPDALRIKLSRGLDRVGQEMGLDA
jgi:DNA-directed RNA polymerase specialized sigma24 family protein